MANKTKPDRHIEGSYPSASFIKPTPPPVADKSIVSPKKATKRSQRDEEDATDTRASKRPRGDQDDGGVPTPVATVRLPALEPSDDFLPAGSPWANFAVVGETNWPRDVRKTLATGGPAVASKFNWESANALRASAGELGALVAMGHQIDAWCAPHYAFFGRQFNRIRQQTCDTDPAQLHALFQAFMASGPHAVSHYEIFLGVAGEKIAAINNTTLPADDIADLFETGTVSKLFIAMRVLDGIKTEVLGLMDTIQAQIQAVLTASSFFLVNELIEDLIALNLSCPLPGNARKCHSHGCNVHGIYDKSRVQFRTRLFGPKHQCIKCYLADDGNYDNLFDRGVICDALASCVSYFPEDDAPWRLPLLSEQIDAAFLKFVSK